MNTQRTSLALISLNVLMVVPSYAEPTAAPNATMRYVAGSVLRDDQGGQQLLGVLSLTLGDRTWVSLGGGQAHSEQGASQHRPNLLTGGLGVMGTSWQTSVGVTDHHDGVTYRQRDWFGSVDWHNNILLVGVTGTQRDAASISTVATDTSSGGTAYIPVKQTVKGNGIGLHGRWNATDRLSVFAEGMKYHYTVTTQQNGTTTTTDGSNGSGLLNNLLANQSLLSQNTLTRTSLVTRDEAALNRSAAVGANYQFDRVLVTGEYINDQVLDAPGSINTLQAKAAINVAPRWVVTPGIGQSHSQQYGGVNYGLLTIAYAW